jgi:hypothetical protein
LTVGTGIIIEAYGKWQMVGQQFGIKIAAIDHQM